MKIVIPGGSGQVGTLLTRAFTREGHTVIVLSRQPGGWLPWRVVGWDGTTFGPWVNELEEADAVINLAGRSVNCRYTPQHRREILESRVKSAQIVGTAIRQCRRPPRLWLQASTATIYASRHDAPNDETTGLLGGAEPDAPDAWRFSIEVAQAWERAALAVATPPTRQVLLRSAITMNPDPGSAFSILLRLVRLGLGGRAGDGRQFVSWIHQTDFIRAIAWLIAHPQISGVVNVTSPHPLPNAEFMEQLREAEGAPFGLPSPAWLLELGARAIGTETELLLKSRRVVPEVLTRSGFAFEFPLWREAAADLCARARKR